MSTRSDVVEAVTQFGSLVRLITDFTGERELRITIAPAEFVAFADFLHDRFAARPELMAAEDTRGQSGGFTLRYIFELPARDLFVIVSMPLENGQQTFPSIGTRWYLASLFEREIHDMFGLVPLDHPDLRRLALHQFWPDGYHPLLKDAVPPEAFQDEGQPFPFQQVQGEGIYQITVGPVHAGIIEPGHFRFSVDGETIVNLESRLFFVHKGIEKLFESMPFSRGVELAERISGDSSVAHALAFSMAVERCAGIEAPKRAAYLRVVFQELERMYNHIADVGAICTDTGYAVANAHAMRLREDLLRLNERLAGHRLLRGAVVPGGVTGANFSNKQIADALNTVQKVRDDFNEVVEMALDSALVLDRLHGTGVLTNRTARELQVCGIAARASGIDADARRDHPYAAYGDLPFRVPVFQEGDVWCRMMVRVEEVRESTSLIVRALEALPGGDGLRPVKPPPAGTSAFGLVEGWRGPVWHWVVVDEKGEKDEKGENGTLRRVKVKDPSFSNWPALNYAILKNIVPDFPLCNKSFNLSYAGNDL
jgi:Ni,Fe-hydrogenase III large subunit/Ni,Fe-hydrogenase III component G